MSINEKVIQYGLLFAAVILSVFALLNNANQKQFISVDVKQISKDFQYVLSKSTLDTNQKEQKIKEFGQLLPNIFHDYAQKNHVIVLVTPAVVSGVTDQTNQFEKVIFKAVGLEF